MRRVMYEFVRIVVPVFVLLLSFCSRSEPDGSSPHAESTYTKKKHVLFYEVKHQEQIPVSMIIESQLRPMDMSFQKLSQATNQPELKRLHSVMQAMIDGKPDAIRPYTLHPGDPEEKANVKNMKSLINAAHHTQNTPGNSFTSSRIRSEHRAGPYRIYTVQLDPSNKTPIGSIVLKKKGDKWYWAPFAFRRVTNVLNESIRHTKTDSATISSFQKQDYQFQRSLVPNRKNGSLSLHFNGINYDTRNAFDEPDPDRDYHPAMKMYLDAHQVLKSGDLKKFGQFYTEQGQDYISRVIEDDRLLIYGIGREMTMKLGKYIEFMIKADPFYIIFYRSRKAPEQSLRNTLQHEIIFRTEQHNYKLMKQDALLFDQFLSGPAVQRILSEWISDNGASKK